jgi:hypothetical protein
MKTPTAWDFRNKLMAILNVAKHSGKPYVDVESGNLHKELGGDSNSHHTLPIFHEVMTKMMRPGDSILQEPRNEAGTTMLVRYILNAKHDNLKNDRQVANSAPGNWPVDNSPI